MQLDLDNQEKLESILRDDPSVLEPLYWAMEDALYKNEVRLAKAMYIDFAYFAKYRKEDLIRALKPAYLDRLKVLAFELFDGKSLKERKPITLKSASQSTSIPFQREAELRDHLAAKPKILSDALATRVCIMDTEVLTEEDYRCDILAKSDTHYYPIELKIRQANHAVVSQITKYCFYFYRKFRYTFHLPIQGIVVANGFDAWSINELRREGIRCFSIVSDDESVKLREEK